MVAMLGRQRLRISGRIATVRPATARLLLAGLVGLIVASALTVGPVEPLGDRDHLSIVAAMRAGSDYYGLIAGIVPAGAFTSRLVPLPTLALVESTTGAFGMTILLCAVLASILLTGYERIQALFADKTGRIVGALLLFVGAASAGMLAVVEPHAGWVALLASWSLLLRQRGRWIEAAALGAIATTIDPAALIFSIVMAAGALRDDERHEAGGWIVAAALGAATWLAHRFALSHLDVPPIGIGAPASPAGIAAAALLPGAPGWLAAMIGVLAVAGWTVMRGALASRAAVSAILGMAVAFVPGMRSAATITTVLLPLGLFFAAETVRSLVRLAASRRRITVTRVARREQAG